MKFFDPRPPFNNPPLDKCNKDYCPLKKNQSEANFVYFEYHGELKDVNIIFVGEAPGFFEEKYKQPFYPKAPAGRILRQVIIDLNIQNYGIANVICCRPYTVTQSKRKTIPPSFKNRTPSEEEFNYCSDHLKIFITNINPKSTIILLGKTATFAVLRTAKKYIGNNTKITPLTKLPLYIWRGRKFACNFHPRYITSCGGIKGKRYQEYLARMKEILNG